MRGPYVLYKTKGKTFLSRDNIKDIGQTGGILHRNLDRLNSLWYRFSIYCLVQVARWPNQTTGELVRVTYLRATGVNMRETWV